MLTTHNIERNECWWRAQNRDTVATGGTGAVPKLQIWSASTLGPPAGIEGCDEEGARLELEMASGDQYVLCMAFSPEKTDGKWLMTISANNDHNLRLWDWKTKELLGHGQVRKTPLFAPFIYKSEHFAKTGSGQT